MFRFPAVYRYDAAFHRTGFSLECQGDFLGNLRLNATKSVNSGI
jgi:hypothetical protein